jgi:hypothetical protein
MVSSVISRPSFLAARASRSSSSTQRKVAESLAREMREALRREEAKYS